MKIELYRVKYDDGWGDWRQMVHGEEYMILTVPSPEYIQFTTAEIEEPKPTWTNEAGRFISECLLVTRIGSEPATFDSFRLELKEADTWVDLTYDDAVALGEWLLQATAVTNP